MVTANGGCQFLRHFWPEMVQQMALRHSDRITRWISAILCARAMVCV
jgi:hypothetical protein